MTIATRIIPQEAQRCAVPPLRAGSCEGLSTLLASIVATQAGALERFEAGAAMIAAMVERFEMTPDDRAALLSLLRAHVDEIRTDKARLATLREVTFVFPDNDALLVLPTS